MSFGKEEKKETSIRFCGLGGMGVILVSVILGKAAIFENKNAIQTQSYGAEQRGTKVRSDVIISEADLITYPVIDKTDILVAFSQEAFNFYYPHTKDNSLIFLNSDLIKLKEKRKNVYKIPASTLAKELNNEKVLNMIILGALIKVTGIVSKNSIIKSISDTVSEKFQKLNILAIEKGYSFY